MYDRKSNPNSPPPQLRIPKGSEIVGKVAKVVGASKFVVNCADGKERLCDIPGRFRRKFWIKEGDTILVQPWSVQSDKRGDIIWKYSIMDVEKLHSKNYI